MLGVDLLAGTKPDELKFILLGLLGTKNNQALKSKGRKKTTKIMPINFTLLGQQNLHINKYFVSFISYFFLFCVLLIIIF